VIIREVLMFNPSRAAVAAMLALGYTTRDAGLDAVVK
jgi:hypothetical protein